MGNFVGRCDNCGGIITEDDTRYEGEVGNINFVLCSDCCNVKVGKSEKSEDTISLKEMQEIAAVARTLIDMLDECKDDDFVDTIVEAVISCDKTYIEPERLGI